MNKEIIDKCLDFAEGKKGKFTILMAKKPGFPDTLIKGTERQREILFYVEQKMTTKEVASVMGVSQPTIVEHMGQYRKGVAFYDEWCEFWEFAADARKTLLVDASEGILSDAEIEKYRAKGIATVGDFLAAAVTMSSTSLCKLCATGQGALSAARKTALFDRIREMCYGLLSL